MYYFLSMPNLFDILLFFPQLFVTIHLYSIIQLLEVSTGTNFCPLLDERGSKKCVIDIGYFVSCTITDQTEPPMTHR